MEKIVFDGQQSDERILYTIYPHFFSKYLSLIKLFLLLIFFYLIIFLIGSVVSSLGFAIRTAGFILTLIVLMVGIWWNNTVYEKSKTFITDRRIIRFEIVSPFFQTKRALFWNEALKAKAFTPNLLYRFLKIGMLQVLPILNDQEDVTVTDVFYFDDLANYIDKILFVFKSKPSEIVNLKPFVPKPKGQRETL